MVSEPYSGHLWGEMEETMEKSDATRLDSMEARLTKIGGRMKKADQRIADLFHSQQKMEMKLEEISGRTEWMLELSKQLHELTKVVMADGGEEWMTNEIGNVSGTEMQFPSSASSSSSNLLVASQIGNFDSGPRPITEVRSAQFSTGDCNCCDEMLVCEVENGYGKAGKKLTGSEAHSLNDAQKVFEKMPEQIEDDKEIVDAETFSLQKEIINTFYSKVQNIRLEHPLSLPSVLQSSFNVDDEPPSSTAGNPYEIAKLFPGFGHSSASLVPGTGNLSGQGLKFGVVLSGGQAPGGHNVILGIFDYLQTRPNITLIGEEVAEKRQTLKNVTDYIPNVICKRAEVGFNYGVILIPEGLIDFIPEVQQLITELNEILAHEVVDEAGVWKKKLSPQCVELFDLIPPTIQEQLMLSRDPHGNVQVAKIEIEEMLIQMVETELVARKQVSAYKGQFKGQSHFFGYEGKCGLPSNFDFWYCYALGYATGALLHSGRTGLISSTGNLATPVTEWTVGGTTLTSLMEFVKNFFFGAELVEAVKKQVKPLERVAASRQMLAVVGFLELMSNENYLQTIAMQAMCSMGFLEYDKQINKI